MGLDVAITNVDTEGTASSSLDGTTSSVGLRLGMRTYRQSSVEQLRPVVGFGARGGYTDGENGFTAWTAGAYGELGAVYFLTPHREPGRNGGAAGGYGKRTQTAAPGVQTAQKTTAVTGSLIRVMLGVSF